MNWKVAAETVARVTVVLVQGGSKRLQDDGSIVSSHLKEHPVLSSWWEWVQASCLCYSSSPGCAAEFVVTESNVSTTACNADGVWSSQCVSTVLLSPLHTTLLPGQIMIGGCCVYNTSGQCWGSGEANESVSGVGVRRTSHRRGSGWGERVTVGGRGENESTVKSKMSSHAVTSWPRSHLVGGLA